MTECRCQDKVPVSKGSTSVNGLTRLIRRLLVSVGVEIGSREKRAIEELLQLNPEITIGWIRSQDLPISMGRDYRDDYLDGLRKAGLPE